MKNIDLAWILVFLLIASFLLYYKDDIKDLVDERISINSVIREDNSTNSYNQSIVSYSENNSTDEDISKDYVTGSEYSFDN